MHSSDSIREKFLGFFREKAHSIIGSASLVPENDPSVLFNTAWMQPLVPYLLWQTHPLWKRLANSQKCVRLVDIDEVWDNTHLTFFEMLWNWSLGDYFKEWAIKMSHEFLTSSKWLWINPKYLAVSVFAWDNDAKRDELSASIWHSLWIPVERISYLWKKDNWWAAWDTWPCWPDTEIFYWVWAWEPHPSSNVMHDPNNWMEIWNNVFMEFNRLPDWSLVSLPAQNVDTWMWLERITAALSWVKSVYDTDLFKDVIAHIKHLTWKNYQETSWRIIADHIRSSVMLISDWVSPSNVDQWYILRRLIRRSIREFYKMWYEKDVTWEIWALFIEKYRNIFPNIENERNKIISELNQEEKRFCQTIKHWLKEFDKVRESVSNNLISSKQAFTLYDTYWFPIEMTQDLAKEYWLSVDIEWFKDCFRKHQELSRSWSEKKFKWWLASSWTVETRYHTATHILHKALIKVLWPQVQQKWSNITAERLRFDFNYSEKLSNEQIKEIERLVNDVIESHLDVFQEEMTVEEAKNQGAIWLFDGKYWEKIKVYTIWKSIDDYFSKEICWWPHVGNTREIWIFRIQKEESSSAWIRRIKAVLI